MECNSDISTCKHISCMCMHKSTHTVCTATPRLQPVLVVEAAPLLLHAEGRCRSGVHVKLAVILGERGRQLCLKILQQFLLCVEMLDCCRQPAATRLLIYIHI